MTPADYLRNRASAYLLDAEHTERTAQKNPNVPPHVRRLVALELEEAAQKFEDWCPGGAT